MSTNFSFPEMPPAQIAEALHTYGIAPIPNLRAEDIANPQPELLPNVLMLLFTEIIGDDLDDQLGFDYLLQLDNPDHYTRAIQLRRLYCKARDFLDSIYFGGLTLRDLVRPHPRRVVDILSAIVNYLHFRQEKVLILEPIFHEYPEDRVTELRAKITEHQKKKADLMDKEQMQDPVVQQLEAEVNTLKSKIQEYNTQQLALRSRAKAIDEKKEGIVAKISQADFELNKHSQENSMLLSKIGLQVPELLYMVEEHAMVFFTDFLDAIRSTLEEKKRVRDELKGIEKMAMHNIQDKNNTLEVYTKAYEKLSKQFSKISALHETSTATKASEKDVKANKAKICDQNLEIKTLRIKAGEWQLKVNETEDRLKSKEKERDRRIEENKQKMTTLKSEVESELKCLADREKKTEEKIAKAVDLCSQADSVEDAGRKQREEIYATFDQVCEAGNLYMDGIDRSIKEVDEANAAITAQIGA